MPIGRKQPIGRPGSVPLGGSKVLVDDGQQLLSRSGTPVPRATHDDLITHEDPGIAI